MTYRKIKYDTRTIVELSDDEQKRLKDILEELKALFNANSIGLISENTVSNKTDYTIRIYNGDNIGFIYR